MTHLSRVRAGALAAVAAMCVLTPALTAHASPPSVDNVLASIGRNIDAGKWAVASKNIADLNATIRDALTMKRVAVQVTSNPVATALAGVRDRGRYILEEKAALVSALNQVEKLGSSATNAALANIYLEMYRKLSLIKPSPDAGDLPGAADTQTAQQIVSQCRRLADARKRAAYLKSVIASLNPALADVKAQKRQLVSLDAQMSRVLSSYGITVGGPAVQPGANPTSPAANRCASWAGVWDDATGVADLTLTQSGASVSGTYPYHSGRLQGTVNGTTLSGTWVESDNSGTFSLTMSADGTRATGPFVITDGAGAGGSVPNSFVRTC